MEDRVRRIFRDIWDFEVRDTQLEAILACLKGQDVFVGIATGQGKSQCYQCIPLCLDEPKLVFVVSPLRALITDQAMVEIAIRLELQETFTSKEDAVCAVCLEKTGNQQTRILYCKHVYHAVCITKWQKINNTCPKNNQQLQSEEQSNGGNAEGTIQSGELLFFNMNCTVEQRWAARLANFDFEIKYRPEQWQTFFVTLLPNAFSPMRWRSFSGGRATRLKLSMSKQLQIGMRHQMDAEQRSTANHIMKRYILDREFAEKRTVPDRPEGDVGIYTRLKIRNDLFHYMKFNMAEPTTY
ncbi:hypothetical protein Bbelb_187190 [Branchiostoma belcheri]|nr:hypothetical protein Bbelb_187190 [Branchiostoma belcheri]